MMIPFQRSSVETVTPQRFDGVSDEQLEAMISDKNARRSPEVFPLMGERARRRLVTGRRLSHSGLLDRSAS